MAIELAKLLNCSVEAGPCGECRNCLAIEKGISPDAIMLLPGAGGEIQVAAARDFIWRFSLRPYDSPYKIAIIDNAHLLNGEAQNCILKTLEEPKGKSLIIMITEFPELLLPTIRSRTEPLKFFPVPGQEIMDFLSSIGKSQKEAEKIAAVSGGKPGQAITFSQDFRKLEKREELISDIIKLEKSDLFSRFKYAKDLSDRLDDAPAGELRQIFSVWLSFLRAQLAAALSENDIASVSAAKKRIRALQFADHIVSATNCNKKLAMETMMLEL